ncbi:unnamed protein product, partial [Tenebrio molitor]
KKSKKPVLPLRYCHNQLIRLINVNQCLLLSVIKVILCD